MLLSRPCVWNVGRHIDFGKHVFGLGPAQAQWQPLCMPSGGFVEFYYAHKQTDKNTLQFTLRASLTSVYVQCTSYTMRRTTSETVSNRFLTVFHAFLQRERQTWKDWFKFDGGNVWYKCPWWSTCLVSAFKSFVNFNCGNVLEINRIIEKEVFFWG